MVQQLVVDRDYAKAKEDLSSLLETMQSSLVSAVGTSGVMSLTVLVFISLISTSWWLWL